MNAGYQKTAQAANGKAADRFARDVLTGLSRSPKTLPSMYFYDEQGSRLFQQISELDEYYLTRVEGEILERYGNEISRLVEGRAFRLVELGAGDGRKTRVLLRSLLVAGLEFEYVPIDICEGALVELTGSLRRRMPDGDFRVRGIVGDYVDALSLLDSTAGRTMVLFLGSNIGNFEPDDAVAFLRAVRRSLAPGDWLLIGFDLKKDPAILSRAYNDAQGITREFNFNLLERINRELGGDFDRERFRHDAPYNVELGRMESWLVSRVDQRVCVGALDRSFDFSRGEGIHVECSYKYDTAQIARMAAAADFAVQASFFDRRRLFVDSLWEAA
jgi:L-histidine Nalpha-methyltransferase